VLISIRKQWGQLPPALVPLCGKFGIMPVVPVKKSLHYSLPHVSPR
jgi:hypothetical protein